MRPWFAPPAAARQRPAPRPDVPAETIAQAWARAYAETRRHWLGGVPGRADLACLIRCVARDLNVTAEAVEKARSTPA